VTVTPLFTIVIYGAIFEWRRMCTTLYIIGIWFWPSSHMSHGEQWFVTSTLCASNDPWRTLICNFTLCASHDPWRTTICNFTLCASHTTHGERRFVI
jgi:hypothetical protein